MPEKEPPGKVRRLLMPGRGLKSLWSRLSSRLGPSHPQRDQAARLLVLLTLSLLLALLLSPRTHQPLRQYRVGDIARENLKATGEFLVEDVETTAQRQQEILEYTPPVYDLDEQLADRVQQRFQKAMEFMRQGHLEGRGASRRQAPGRSAKALPELKPEFDRLLGVTIPNPTFYLLAKSEFSPYLEAMITQVLGQFYHQGVVSSRDIMQPDPKEILVRRLPSLKEQLERSPYSFVDLEGVRKSVAGYCREVAGDFAPAERWLVCDLAQYLLVPNVSPNRAETQARQQARLKELRPVYYRVRPGEMIIREGERLTPLHLAKLGAQSRIYPRGRGILIFLGIFASLVLLLTVSYELARLSLPQLSSSLRDLTFLAVLLLGNTLLSKGMLSLGATISRVLPEVGQNLIYVLPLGLAPIFAAMFLGLEAGVGLAFLSATLTAFLVDKPFPIFLYFVIAGLVGVWGVHNCRHRGALIKAGLAISLANMGLLAAFKLLEYPMVAREVLLGETFALSGGLLTGILALGLTPIMEALFRYSSNIRLLELLNLDQPVLKELMLMAPGTYHHSLVVGQMVEAAAEAIGANPLLAKAAAYYHDIGKIKKPNYFVENQRGGENKHEKLAPSMSSLILIAHVKDGVDLARKHRLGKAIISIIQQHHGSSSISYFYHKARTQAGKPQQVKIQDYRYPGPRPQTREAGLVLLADQVEAASKALTDPTPARIQGLVQKIIYNVFSDGQLDECPLTLKDLHSIAKSFNKILSGIFHQRIHYPSPFEKKRAHEDLDKQPAKKNADKTGESQEKGREDLKRLGLV
jgi:putative nucleotidyltransferase with HDIG domain